MVGILTGNIFNVRNPLVCPWSPPPLGIHIDWCITWIMLMTFDLENINFLSNICMTNAPVNVDPQGGGDRGQTRGFLTLKMLPVRIPTMGQEITVRKPLLNCQIPP
jgi:hypothetical protein